MSRVLIVEDSIIVQALFKELLDRVNVFHYDIASSYEEAKRFLSQKRYEYCIAERVLKDAEHGEIIALLNKHHLAPLLFTNHIDEDFFDDFEGAYIVEYIQKIKFDNEKYVIQKLLQLQENKKKTLLVVSDSKIYSSYLKQNLNLHNFKVFNAYNDAEAYNKLALHPEISLLIIDTSEPYVNALDIVLHAREKQKRDTLKIIILTEESNSYATSKLLHYGADDFLIKDFSRDEFYTRIYQNINNLG